MASYSELAIKDPTGCRMAWLDYGQTIGWQPQQYGPVKFPAGKENWLGVIVNTEPAQLGMAWQALEERENKAFGADQKEWPDVPQKRKDDDMGILQWKETVTLEPGYYPAMVKSIEETVGEFADDKRPGQIRKVPQLKFVFSILNEDGQPATKESGEPLEQWAWASATWGPRAKLFDWAKVLLKNKCPAPGYPLDYDLLIGKKCDIEIELADTPNGQRPKVVKVLPFRSMSSQTETE